MICHHWYSKNIGYKFESYVRSSCHDLMPKAMSFNDIAIVSIKGNDCRIHFWYMSKDGAINVTRNSNLNRKLGSYKYFFIIY